MNESYGIHNLSLREFKKRKAQNDIETAALRLFLEKGYENTSIKDITDEVMMSSRTFFRYFASKEEILTGSPITTKDERLQLIQSSSDSLDQALQTIFSVLSEKYEQNKENLMIRYHISKQAESISSLFLYKLLEPEIVICDDLCISFKDTDKDHIRFQVAIHMAAFRVSVEMWLENNEREESLKTLLFYHVNQFK
ncbi:TetR family transcriptional regulator [Alkalicoccobacillus plakortidis]|uniref:TetR family transcriptional regulator n=1 Tax=Alkalicoccobacillus plakortidis TaxID=444060 RepID=A0ABT0XNH0_9BACI|nr:TetR/AcrR family transcriptional regulator [Alkalicoccobacillus plakortidis]MCM2677454.1 TetR family transcriptional regulator [Alkalicoccobacillus plakortidis]